MKKLLTSISIVWCDDDVRQQMSDMNERDDTDIELTPEEISDVLSLMESEHDASMGLSWDTIEYHIDTILSERKV